MDLKNILSKVPLTHKEMYWALVIEFGWIHTGIWEINEGKAEVIALSPPTQWETDNDLIGAADTVLSAAIQNLPEDENEPTKTVFGVPSAWVENGQIKGEILDKVKKICTDLSLEPAGFVVLPEAIAHLYKSEEGSPLNAVVLGIGKEDLEVTVFNLGNLLGTSTIGRSVSIVDDVIEGLTRFNLKDPLPSRILIYDGKEGELEDDRQELLDANWDGREKIKFLHTPKIEIVPADKKVIATSLAGASEIAKVQKVEVRKDEFIERNDEPGELENVTYPKEQINPQDLGFMVGEDIVKKQVSSEISAQQPVKQEITKSLTNESSKLKPQGFKSKLLSIINKITQNPLKKITVFAKKIFYTNKVEDQFTDKKMKKTALVILGLLFVGLVVGFMVWWFLPRAVMTIYVSPKKLEDKLQISVDLNTSGVDLSRSILPGTIQKAEVSGEKTKATSGIKTIGEKARGTITIQNGTATILNLAAGTIILGSNNLKFTLDKSASVSAALSPSSPGTGTVDVSAYDIGADYNLAKGENFKVANYPKADVDAVSTTTFSGGSSQQIPAVSAEDQKSLEKELVDELSGKGKKELLLTIGEGKYFIEQSLTATASSKQFSGKIGDEASNLKLSLALTVSGILVDKKNLFDIAKESLINKVPSGYSLEDNELTTMFSLVNSKSNVYNFDVLFSTDLLPQINKTEIAKNIAGKNKLIAENYLSNIPGFTRAEIKLKPNFLAKLGTLPHIFKNISVNLSAEK